MGYPQADERRLWQSYSALNRRRRRAILMRARKRVAPELAAGSTDYELALQRQIVDLMRDEHGETVDPASHLFDVLGNDHSH